MSNIAIILASGVGSRFGAHIPKQFLKLAGKTVIEHTLDAFERHAAIDEIIIVGQEINRHHISELVLQAGYKKVSKIVIGGETRQQSSMAGISAVEGDEHKVLVHDGVRPLIDNATIDRCLNALDEAEAVDTAIPASDTVIKVDDDSNIDNIPDRSKLRLGQTPQAFRAGLLRKAHAIASQDKELKVTDDCGLILHYNLGKVKVVAGDTSNIKITYPSDIYLADRLFQLRSNPAKSALETAKLADKNIVVFGASRGIGQHITEIAKEAGANVLAVSRQSGVDVQQPLDVNKALSQAYNNWGRIDAVIVTAGLLRTGLLAGQDDDAIADLVNVNLLGSINVAKQAYKFLKHSGGSIALFTSSSYTRGRAQSVVYSATKAAIVNLMQGLAEEYRPADIRINAINPERTHTPMRTENFGNEPMDKLLDAKKVARVTLAVCLSDSTGEVVDVRR